MVRSSRLKAIFGADCVGDDPAACARASKQMFVRSEDHLAFDNQNATGRRLTAWEALNAFGLDALEEILDFGSAVIAVSNDEPANSIKTKREVLGISPRELAKVSDVTEEDVRSAENPRVRTDIHTLTKIAQKLNIDDLRLSTVSGGSGEARFAYRVRSLRTSKYIKASTVFSLNEAAWVIAKQTELSRWLGKAFHGKSLCEWGFVSDFDYGNYMSPAWRQGFRLSEKARNLLGIPLDAPINSLRSLLEDTLSVPVVQMSLETSLAGATIEAEEGQRGVLVNLSGNNENVLVRRATLAHELAHLLWDAGTNFQNLTVDSYSALEKGVWEPASAVEARANAFSVNFLAPRQVAVEMFQGYNNYSDGLRAVMDHFGISYTAAKWQIYNGLYQGVQRERLTVESFEAADEWKGRENFTLDMFKPKSTPESRRGKFAYCVAESLKRGLISRSSAAVYLKCSEEEADRYTPSILQQFAQPGN
ncbi:ImmA/IrrE family metallo-endopeptidase [Azospirillum argentinense]